MNIRRAATSFLLLSSIAVIVYSMSACSSPENTAEEADPLTVGTNVLTSTVDAGADVDTSTRQFLETSVAVDSAGTAVIAYIDVNAPALDAGVVGSHNGWAVSTDWSTAATPTWVSHSTETEDWLPSIRTDQMVYSGDPTVLATTKTGQFVYVSIFGDQYDKPNTFDTVIAVSNDSGATFINPTRVSTPTTMNVDQPTAAINPTTGEIWVLWRKFPLNMADSGSWWLRKLHVTAAGAVVFDTAPIQVTGANAPASGTKSYALGAGTTANGSPAIWIAWPDQNDGSGCSTLTNLHWNVSASFNGGSTWTKTLIATDTAWPCLVDTSQENRNRPQFLFAPKDSACFVAINRHSSMGTVAEAYRSTDGTTWTKVVSAPFKGSGPRDQWGQSLGYTSRPTDTSGRVALVWMDTRDDLASNKKVSIYGSVSTAGGAAGTWTAATKISNGAGVPWNIPDTWVDYNGTGGAVSSTNGKLVTAWPDARSSPVSKIWSAVLTP